MRWLLFSIAAVGIACSDSPSSSFPDVGVAADSGVIPSDGGVVPDGGMLPEDSGVVRQKLETPGLPRPPTGGLPAELRPPR